MAMRGRGGNAAAARRRPSQGVVRPVYEAFRPVSEWQQDDESHILIIYLPGFTKEQIRVSTEGRNIIRVRGERLVAGNKWSRLLEDFRVPDDGEMNSVKAKYQGGILTVTVLKKRASKPQEVLSPEINSLEVQKQATSQKGQDKVSSEVSTSKPSDEKSLEPQKRLINPVTGQGSDGNQKQGRDHILTAVNTSQSKDEKAFSSPITASDPRKDHGHDDDDGDRRKMEVDKQVKKSEENKELPEVETAKKMKLDGVGCPEEKAADKEPKGKHVIHSSGVDYGPFTVGKYKKAMKGLAELNEERQLLVNMGVAVLVIMAVSAYFTYKFASEKDKN